MAQPVSFLGSLLHTRRHMGASRHMYGSTPTLTLGRGFCTFAISGIGGNGPSALHSAQQDHMHKCSAPPTFLRPRDGGSGADLSGLSLLSPSRRRAQHAQTAGLARSAPGARQRRQEPARTAHPGPTNTGKTARHALAAHRASSGTSAGLARGDRAQPARPGHIRPRRDQRNVRPVRRIHTRPRGGHRAPAIAAGRVLTEVRAHSALPANSRP